MVRLCGLWTDRLVGMNKKMNKIIRIRNRDKIISCQFHYRRVTWFEILNFCSAKLAFENKRLVRGIERNRNPYVNVEIRNYPKIRCMPSVSISVTFDKSVSFIDINLNFISKQYLTRYPNDM